MDYGEFNYIYTLTILSLVGLEVCLKVQQVKGKIIEEEMIFT